MKDVMKFAYYLLASRAPNIKVVPGGGVEPPKAEARRILSVTLDLRKFHRHSIFYDLHFKWSRDWCSPDESRAGPLRTLCAHPKYLIARVTATLAFDGLHSLVSNKAFQQPPSGSGVVVG
jgi:hypothetical protein